jgi:DNA polymerase III alpha subunit
LLKQEGIAFHDSPAHFAWWVYFPGVVSFNDFTHFLKTVDARRVNKKVFASLVGAGCMDDIWGISRPELVEKYDSYKEIANKQKAKEKAAVKKQEAQDASFGGGSLFDKLNGSYIEI